MNTQDLPGKREPKPFTAGFLQNGRLLSLGTIPRAWNAAFSRGASYEQVPTGRHFSATEVRGYYLDFRDKTEAAAPAEALLPGALAQLGLGWWERSLEGDGWAMDELLRVCRLLDARGWDADDGRRWLHDISVRKYAVGPPFSSALAQGQIASLFVRAHLATGEPAYALTARRAVEPLLAERTTDLVTLTPAGPILEELPSEPRSHILNGWISALWGLLDVGLGLEEAGALEAYEQNVACLVAVVDLYDTDWWSKYSLYPWSMADLAKPIYHRFHCDQLDVLARLTGDSRLATVAARWKAYDTRARRTRLLAQKTVFVTRHSRDRLRVRAPWITVIS